MRKPLLLTCCLVCCLISCYVQKHGIAQRDDTNGNAEDSAQVVYNDSIDWIVRNSKTAILYDMENLVKEDNVAERHDSLLCFAIEKKVGGVKKEKLEVLRFILTDTSLYIRKYAPIRQPFCPSFALEFKCGKEKAFFFVSFNTNEIAISDAEMNFMFYRIRDLEVLARWIREYFPENDFYNNIIKKYEDESN